MKKKNILVIGIILILILFNQQTFAQSGRSGLGTATPRAKFEINGDLMVDTMKTPTLKDSFVVITGQDTTPLKKEGRTDFQYQFGIKDPIDPCNLDGKVMMEAFLTMIPTYIDDCTYLFGSPIGSSGIRLLTYDKSNWMQSRSVLTDWADALACYGRVKVGSNLLVNIKATSTSEQRIYLYPYGSLTNTAGTVVPFIGQSIPLSPTNITRMFYDGQYFLFSYQAGNGNNELIFSKYTFDGTSLTYVNDVTFSPPVSLSGSTFNSLVKGSNNFYYLQFAISGSEISITKYDSSGSYTGLGKSFPATGISTVNMTCIGGNIFMYYNNSNAPTVKKMILF